jgi:hypothetical protein
MVGPPDDTQETRREDRRRSDQEVSDLRDRVITLEVWVSIYRWFLVSIATLILSGIVGAVLRLIIIGMK